MPPGGVRVATGGRVDKLGAGVGVTGFNVRNGTFRAVVEVVEAMDGEVVGAMVLEGSESGAVCAAARAACFWFSLVTPTATPTMTLRTMRKMRTMIAMPLFVLYQGREYVGTGEGVSSTLG